jgi:phospholipid/cholesterol/gamma-HCH transport system ATP-binding protein
VSAEPPTNAERVNYLLPDAPRWPVDPAAPVISLRGVVKRFGDLTLMDGLDLDIHTGMTTVLCGRSGCGKSVLLRLMNGLMLPDEGVVTLFGEDTAKVHPQRLIALRKRLTMMFQSYALMDSFTVTENIAFPLYENTSMKWADIAPMVQDLLDLLDLGDAGGKMPSELSGGMKKRVSLARAVVSNPEVVLFDEPTTGLDPVMIEFVDQMIIRTREHYGITSVIVSHDMTSTLRLADRIAMLDEGRVVAYGDADDVIAQELDLVKVFFAGAETVRGLSGGGLEATPSLAAPDPAGSEEDEIVVEVSDVYKSFGPHDVLKGVSLQIPKNKITVIIGGSGSGKSVIMKHIIGLIQPNSGTVSVFGQDMSKLDSRQMLEVRARFGMLFQGAALLDSMSVRQNVAFPLVERGGSKAEVSRETDAILDKLSLLEISDNFPSQISNGQRKRVGLARAIITQPEIMIYDEPTTGQDPVMIRYVDDMIVEAQELFDITALVVSHDMASAFRVAHRIAFLHEGEIRACGTPQQVSSSPDPWVRRFIYAGTPEGDRACRELGIEH